MTTLGDMTTTLSRRLRDTGNATWSTDALRDIINQGIDTLADLYPREVVTDLGVIVSNVRTYDVSALTSVYRVDLWAGSAYHGTVDMALPGQPDSGWETHGGLLYLPATSVYTDGDTVRAYGYGRYAQLAASSSTTDLDQAGIWAVLVFSQAEALSAMLADRAAFHQWQAAPGNTDVSPLMLAQLVGTLQARWQREQRRLRRMRKT